MKSVLLVFSIIFFLLILTNAKPKNQVNYRISHEEENACFFAAMVFCFLVPGWPDFLYRCSDSADFDFDDNSELAVCQLKDKEKENCVTCVEPECECRPHKDTKTSSIAIKAAQEAKEAQDAQQIAGAQAAHQVKAQLAEKAEQAARAAEAALSGKQVLVDQLEHEVREAQAVVQEEAASCQRTQINLQISCAAAAQARHLLKTLTTALQISQCNLANSQEAAEGVQQELAEKAALLDAAKCRAEALIRELTVARQDLCAIKQAAYKALCAARNACCNAQRSRRQSHRNLQGKRRITELLKRAKRSENEIRSILKNVVSNGNI